MNVVERLPEEEQWTNFYSAKKKYSQFDYIFLSKSLADQNTNQPVIMKKGLPKKAQRYTGERFEKVVQDKPKASDHAPVYIDLNLDNNIIIQKKEKGKKWIIFRF